MIQNQKFDRKFFKEFWRLLKPYWQSEEKGKAWGLLSLIMLGTIIQVRASVALNNFFREFFDAIQNFNTPVIIQQSWHFLIIISILILAFGYGVYFTGVLSIRWRRWLTNHYMKDWLQEHTFYTMQILHKNVDNPDQRISEDLDSFPGTTLTIFFNLFQSLLTLVAFSIILWNLSGTLPVHFGKFGTYNVHGYLFIFAIIYAVIGTLITVWVGKRLPRLSYLQQFYNANFRFGLVRTRESSEQISLYRGETVENESLQFTFGYVFQNYLSIVGVSRNLSFFQNAYRIFSYLFGYLAGVPLFYLKRVQIGGLLQISSAFGEVQSALSIFVYLYNTLADWRATIFRLVEFSDHIQEARETLRKNPINSSVMKQNRLITKNLIVSTPKGKKLVENLNLEINTGEKWLIRGRTGTGKSTLIRALAGLWPYGSGKIEMPTKEDVLFLPQKPYLPLGSLKDALAYPQSAKLFSDEKFHHVLKLCRLENFTSELDKVEYWAQELSGGEQQLVAFARIFLKEPRWIFLDEATSALDELSEMEMYETLHKHLPDATVVSVGHRSSLEKFHSHQLNL